MKCNTTILVGPARAGKTSQLLTAYRTAAAADPPGSALWIGPNRAAVDSIRRALIGPVLQQCLQPNCLTFAKLSQLILEATSSRLRPVDELMKRRLLEGIVRRGITAGKIRHFASIAGTPGLIRMVAGVIRQWKRLEIWPAEFAAACAQSGLAQKDAELLWIYEEYQQLLTRHELYDAEGRLWVARTQLREGNFRPFEAVRYVFVDGFTDFTRTELETLILFAGQAETMHITLPGEGSNVRASRNDLFAKPMKTLVELRERLPSVTVHQLDRRVTAFSALDSIEANLFRPAGTFDPPASDGVTIVAAAGRRQEFEGLARRIKALLTRDTSPVNPEQILVVLRTLSENRALLDEVFTRFGIPVAIEEPPRLGQSACVSSLIAWLKLAVEDWPFRQLLAMLSHNSLQPDWPQWKQGRAALAAEQLVRELQVPRGRAELLAALERRAAQINADAKDPHEQLQAKHLQLAIPLMLELARVTNALPSAATPCQWIVALTSLANEVGVHRLISSTDAELAAWKLLMAYLRSIDRLHQWTGPEPSSRADSSPAPQLGSGEVLNLITEIASSESGPGGYDSTGRVRVVSAATARSLAASHVFIAGLTEKSFPATSGESALYGDAEISQLATAGLPLPTKADRSRDEMLLFYEILTRATCELVLSYPGLDDKAQPMPSSPYLSELERAFHRGDGQGGIRSVHENALSPVPDAQALFCERDWRLRAIHDALSTDNQTAQHLLAGILHSGAGLATAYAANMKSALLMLHSRTRRAFGPFEGLLESVRIHKQLAARFGADRLWSASQLERYAYCPFQYFMSRLLRVEPLAELSLDTDHLLRGNILHETLSRLHRQLNQKAGKPVSLTSLSEEEYAELASEVLKEVVATEGAQDPLTRSLHEVDRRVLSQWLLKYYGQYEKYDTTWGKQNIRFLPAHFEVAFGPDQPQSSNEDAPSLEPDTLHTSEPLELKYGDETVRIGGRVDRVDLATVGDQTVFHVIDYKSSSKMTFKPENVVSGERLQLALYALALEQLLLVNQKALPWRATYWLVREKGIGHKAYLDFHEQAGSNIQPTETWLAIREQLPEIVAGLVHGIRGGQFPVYCADEKCTSRCEFHTVCRIGQIRSLEKVWLRGASAEQEQNQQSEDPS